MKHVVFVVNLHAQEEAEQAFEYIGRASRGLKASPLANPFRIGVGGHTREKAIAAYTHWLNARIAAGDADVLGELRRLQGLLYERGTLNLGCWCAPKACHGNHLAHLLLTEDFQ